MDGCTHDGGIYRIYIDASYILLYVYMCACVHVSCLCFGNYLACCVHVHVCSADDGAMVV